MFQTYLRQILIAPADILGVLPLWTWLASPCPKHIPTRHPYCPDSPYIASSEWTGGGGRQSQRPAYIRDKHTSSAAPQVLKQSVLPYITNWMTDSSLTKGLNKVDMQSQKPFLSVLNDWQWRTARQTSCRFGPTINVFPFFMLHATLFRWRPQ